MALRSSTLGSNPVSSTQGSTTRNKDKLKNKHPVGWQGWVCGWRRLGMNSSRQDRTARFASQHSASSSAWSTRQTGQLEHQAQDCSCFLHYTEAKACDYVKLLPVSQARCGTPDCEYCQHGYTQCGWHGECYDAGKPCCRHHACAVPPPAPAGAPSRRTSNPYCTCTRSRCQC